MATIHFDADEKYLIKDKNKKLSISAKTTNGQGGAYSFFLEQTFKGVNQEIELGVCKTLKNKTITVSATIKDKLEETNWTNLDVFLKENDETTKQYSYSREAEKHLDTVQYIIKIKIQ